MQKHPLHLQSPTVRVHQSSPTPAQSQSMLAQGPFVGGGWNEGFQGQYLSAIPRNFKDSRYHKRASSDSSVASAGPPSPLDQTNLYPRIATSDATFSPSHYEFDFTTQTAQSSKSLPDSIMFPSNNGFGAVDMRRIQSQGHDERVSYGGPQSVSIMSRNSPVTPQNYDAEYHDEKVYNGNYQSMAYQQSLQDVFPDQTMPQIAPYHRMTAHRQNMMQDRIQAAQQDHLRTNSPTSNPRDKSPFRQSSPYMPAPPPRQRVMPTLQKQRTSISPKELMLDESDVDDSQTPLFPDPPHFGGHRQQASHLANFYTPSFNPEPSIQIPQQYPFVGHTGRQETSGLPDSTPDFPAHLLSMESTNEEGPSEPSSQQSGGRPAVKIESVPSSRPVDTSSDAGTYSCTYHGCSMRFDSPTKLQKHKREGHRQHEQATVATAASSPNLALRNSQAGPHRCDRINPSTGKSCNSIFSRPYDLTRHEDTIHNGRKQKVRCHLCTEEKTFSRNDALTRHMRVVHPDVDWVGKQKRKSPK